MPKKTSLKQFLMKTGRFKKVFDCVSAISYGRITINGKIITNPNYFFNAKKSLIEFDGQKVKLAKKMYYLLNKPAGYLCQKTNDERNIYDLIEKLPILEEQKASLFALGRLDKDTEGLIIITNDGELSNLVLNPKNEIIKKYRAVLENPVDANKIKSLEKGIEISIDYDKYKTKPCKIKSVGEKEVCISISEGKKRQIRKMFQAVGNEVIHLNRVSIGGLQLGKLNVGEMKEISKEEIMENFEV